MDHSRSYLPCDLQCCIFCHWRYRAPASVWISYGFIHFAYIMLLITPKLIRKSSSSAVFGFSLYSISSTYFLVAFIVGVIFIFVRPESYKGSLVVQVIIAGIYAVMLISHMIANEHTADVLNARNGITICQRMLCTP